MPDKWTCPDGAPCVQNCQERRIGGCLRLEEQPVQKDRIEQILTQRGERYGAFDGHAIIAQAIKNIMRESPRWPALTDAQSEALEMIAHKMARILNGDPNYQDSWDDIAGYARLISNTLPD